MESIELIILVGLSFSVFISIWLQGELSAPQQSVATGAAVEDSISSLRVLKTGRGADGLRQSYVDNRRDLSAANRKQLEESVLSVNEQAEELDHLLNSLNEFCERIRAGVGTMNDRVERSIQLQSLVEQSAISLDGVRGRLDEMTTAIGDRLNGHEQHLAEMRSSVEEVEECLRG